MQSARLGVIVLLVGCSVGNQTASSTGNTMPSSSSSVVIQNGTNGAQYVRWDTQGNAIDAHDGNGIRLFDDLYYLVGTSYNCGAAFDSPGTPWCGFKAYTSTDLIHWTDRGLLIDPAQFQYPSGSGCGGDPGCFNPNLVFDASTDTYRIYAFGVFDSPTPVCDGGSSSTGCYNLIPGSGAIGGGFWKDPDTGQGYVVRNNYSGFPGQFDISFSALQADNITVDRTQLPLYLGALLKSHGELPADQPDDPNEPRNWFGYDGVLGEGHAIVKKDGVFYFLYSYPGCPYCSGAVTRYVTSRGSTLTDGTLMGGWLDHGERILHADSCAGQYSGFDRLGPAYLWTSDRWHQVDHLSFPGDDISGRMFKNQGRANTYWTPMTFGADDSIDPVSCAETAPNPWVIAMGSQDEIADLDQSSGLDGMQQFCDIGQYFDWSGTHVERAQTFTVGRTGTLEGLTITTFQGGVSRGDQTPDVDLAVTLCSVDANGHWGDVLGTYTIPRRTAVDGYLLVPAKIGYSPRKFTVAPNIPVIAGHKLGFRVSAEITNGGCYGFAFSDTGAAYPAEDGGEYYSSDSGASWSLEANRAMKFETVVAP